MTSDLLLAFGLAIVVGISLGLLGGGGSILTVPIFVYVLGMEPKVAIAASLLVVGTTSLIGCWRHARLGNVQLQTALVFGAAAMMTSFLAAKLSRFLPGSAQLSLLAVIMFGAAVAMLRPQKLQNPRAPSPSWQHGLLGAGVGALTGLAGVGGGFLIVPSLVVVGGVGMAQAIGTSLAVIAANAATGALGYLGQVSFPWPTIGIFTAGASTGIFLGTELSRRISAARLKQLFGLFLIAVATWILLHPR